jgi:hypothetical protein
MRAINHALTGAVIGLAVGKPALALPAALVSHYVVDAIPHHGTAHSPKLWMRSASFKQLLILDALLCLSLVVVLSVFQPQHWLLASIAAFLAAAPDLASIRRFMRIIARQNWRPGRYSTFATSIQWFERPIGAVVEAAWFVAGVVIIVPFLR